MNQVNPRVDIAFKKIFGVEENKDLLISLINSIVSKEDQVLGVTLLNPYNYKNFKDDKLSVLDIKATGHNGKRFNIEMQMTDQEDYDKRALYYWAKLYTEQLEESGKYSTLSKTIGIHILNFSCIKDNEKYHNIFDLKERETGVKCFEDIELHTIELPKFGSDDAEGMNELLLRVKDALGRWIAFLTKNNLMDQDNLPDGLNDQNIKKALDVLRKMNFTKQEREVYENHLKWMRDEASAIETAEKRALAIGREEGREEANMLTVKRMLVAGLPADFISEITGFSKDQINSIKQ